MNKDSHNHLSDHDLLEKFYADHNNEWLGILLERYTLLLLGVSMKYLKNEEEAKDSVQQIFLKVITELQKYKVEYFKSWVYMVAKNHCLMKLREKNRTMELNEHMISTPEEENDRSSLMQDEHTIDLVKEALQELNPEQKQCVTLFYLHKKSYLQISEETGYTLLQVKSYIQNGKRNLKLMVEKKLKNVKR